MILKTLTLAACLVSAATAVAMAQGDPGTGPRGGYDNNNGMPPKAYKGPGGMPGYASAEYQGKAGFYDQASGSMSDNNGMPPKAYKGPGGMPGYASSEYQARPLYNQAYDESGNSGVPPASYTGPGGMKVYKGAK